MYSDDKIRKKHKEIIIAKHKTGTVSRMVRGLDNRGSWRLLGMSWPGYTLAWVFIHNYSVDCTHVLHTFPSLIAFHNFI